MQFEPQDELEYLDFLGTVEPPPLPPPPPPPPPLSHMTKQPQTLNKQTINMKKIFARTKTEDPNQSPEITRFTPEDNQFFSKSRRAAATATGSIRDKFRQKSILLPSFFDDVKSSEPNTSMTPRTSSLLAKSSVDVGRATSSQTSKKDHRKSTSYVDSISSSSPNVFDFIKSSKSVEEKILNSERDEINFGQAPNGGTLRFNQRLQNTLGTGRRARYKSQSMATASTFSSSIPNEEEELDLLGPSGFLASLEEQATNIIKPIDSPQAS
eukprot:TRINITY_DN13622_c0_g1_i1.p1 TRINITY_DN13622_c0_g1~~TRINITY_DN13622_c0_g1_i1.p1  ORF type:complete len:268 (+),score=76.04 TRINITY_DN13622_c0_g1_i1:59-862(+)